MLKKYIINLLILLSLSLIVFSCGDNTKRVKKKCKSDTECPGGLCDTKSSYCIPYVCTDLDNHCTDSKKVSVCNATGTKMIEKVCSKGCYNGYCIEKRVCSVNEKQCINDTKYVECADTGAEWIEHVCDGSKVCLNGECLEKVCTPNEKSCNGYNKIKQCNSNGSFLMEYNCDTNRKCQNGECIEISCTPNEVRCKDDSTLEKCKTDGSIWVATSCETNQKCDVNRCLDQICTPNEKRCLENNRMFEVCNELGTKWNSIVTCDIGKVCSLGECIEKVCSPGEKRCTADGKVEVCSVNSLDWDLPISCEAGKSCKFGNCLQTICSSNVKECMNENPNYFKQCDQSGTSYLSPIACGAGKTCENGNCKNILCVPNSKRCTPTDINKKSYEVCNEAGTAFSNSINCDANQICLGGECQSKNCEPTSKICDNNILKVCNESANWQNLESCGAGEACTLNGCKSVICTPNKIRCNPENTNYKEKCSSDGTAWINSIPCGVGKTCNAALCKNIICTPSELKCEGNKVEKCNSDGTAFVTESICASNQYCNVGSCENQACVPNSKVCVDEIHIKTCNEQGSRYSEPATCAPNNKCINNECVQIVCQTGEKRCNGRSLETCSSNQLSWNSSFCGAGKTCQAKACVNYACSTNEKECVGNAVYHQCNNSRTGFGEPIACGVNKICTGAGNCVTRTCSPGQIRCRSNDNTKKSYDICNATGSDWTGPANCGNNLLCDTDTNICKSKICIPGDIRCLNENGIPKSQTCNAIGTSWNTPITCGGIDPICTESGCDNVICKAYEEIDCVNSTTYKRCNINGTDWISNTETCASNYLCKNRDGGTDECVPKICTPNSKVCSSNNGYRNCNADGTELSAEVQCENDPASGLAKTCYASECKTACEMSAINKSYMGCNYYAVDMESVNGGFMYKDENSTGNPEKYFYAIIISNPSSSMVLVTITDNTNPGYFDSRLIAPNAIEIFEMDTLINPQSSEWNGITYYTWQDSHQLIGTGFGDRYSYKIVSDLPIIAYQFSPLGGSLNLSNDASILLPTTAYGKEYRVMAWESGYNDSIMTVVAKENNTQVTLDMKTTTVSGGGIPAISNGNSYIHTINAGEILQFVNTTGDATGTKIISDKPIGVFGGNECTKVPTDISACDHLEQQLFPTNTWGSNYLCVKTNQRDTENDYYKIVANNNNTHITFTPTINGISTKTLNEGEVFSFDTDENFKLSSTKPIMVGQFMASQNDGAGTGDPSFILQVPIEQYRKDYLFLVPDTYTYNYVTVIIPVGSTAKLDNSIIASNEYTNIGTTGYKKAILSLSSGSHSVVGTKPVGISVYGYDRFVSYGYPGGLNLKDVK